ncbi:ATP-dependent endonuclease [Thalassospira sp. TSL5-1]|uniref:ATP-dependent nuclease n=1 Tax=Thalassospira sp. TSL5-1 TaxID=1544451 RepID=UPI00093CBCCC|nr:AAA family ATPase [Thalassospira sp. TSL5-1]OKH86671.1 ATPase [Thalassospira sp. TSL5-1]
MIDNIEIKINNNSGTKILKFITSSITVFVGPNNSGKSTILREIQKFCTSGQHNQNNILINKISFKHPTTADVSQNKKMMLATPTKDHNIQPDHSLIKVPGSTTSLHNNIIDQLLTNPNKYTNNFCQFFLSNHTLILNSKNRTELTSPKSVGDLKAAPTSRIGTLFSNDSKREQIRKIVYEAFGKYLVIDPTHLGELSFRLSDRAPNKIEQERGITSEAVDFHKRATPIEHASDGVQAFTGILTEIIAGEPQVLSIDEPEAFLHPSLSYKLGREIAKTSADTKKRIFISTHSSDFVMGCIQSGVPVNIIRLTYQNNSSTARILPNDKILNLMRNPLLRSTRVLQGLFYENVVVTEADSDRAFYQEINERLLMENDPRGISNCLFINAQNKQTVPTIIEPLRNLGISAAGIVDIDILKDGGSTWSQHLRSINLPEPLHQAYADIRKKIKNYFVENNLDMKRNGGISLLDSAPQKASEELFDALDSYGLFTIRLGELESWLKNLCASGHGPSWLIDVFEKMGEDPQSNKYVKPSSGDVWDFMGQLQKWFDNPNRKGIPTPKDS